LGNISAGGSAGLKLDIPCPDVYDFATELKAIKLADARLRVHTQRASANREWLQTRAAQRQEREIQELQRIEAEQKRKQEEMKLKEDQARQQAELMQERERLDALRRAEEERQAAARKVEEDRLQAEQREKRHKNAWLNAQLDLTGGLLEPFQKEAVRNFQAISGETDDYKCIQMVQLCTWDVERAINTFYTSTSLDDAIARLKPQDPPAIMTQVEIVLPNNNRVPRQFRADDSLWVLYAATQELMGRTPFRIMNHDHSLCFSAPEQNLNQTFAQADMVPNGVIHILPIGGAI
jgi:hypothetical protein